MVERLNGISAVIQESLDECSPELPKVGHPLVFSGSVKVEGGIHIYFQNIKEKR